MSSDPPQLSRVPTASQTASRRASARLGFWVVGLAFLGGWGYYLSNLPSWRAIELPWLHGLILATAVVFWWQGRLGAGWLKQSLRRLSLGLALACAGTMLGQSYLDNARLFFYLGLTACLALLFVAKRQLGPSPPGQIFLSTLILFGLALAGIDLATHPSHRVTMESIERRVFSYAVARHDPAAFGRWWQYFTEEWFKSRAQLQMPDSRRILPFRLKPNSEARLFGSVVRINSLGFRGRDFDREKQGAYRIVALGESTTMGCTLRAEDEPWPDVLERLIRERLRPPRPVQVINAGVPAYALVNNLQRLAGDILPLEPDLIISYHGYNGFPYLDVTLPPVLGPPPPMFIDRPIHLFARLEYRLKLRRYLRRTSPSRSEIARFAADSPRALDTPLAQHYRQLVAAAQTNHFKLVVATFSLAVNTASDPEVINFYRQGFPYVDDVIRCNVVHNEIVQLLARPQPQVYFADVRAGLDGRHEKFIDLVHYTQEGRQQLAENMLAAIQPILAEDLPLTPPTAPSEPGDGRVGR
jgi:lysophospholipase L1-like esterase